MAQNRQLMSARGAGQNGGNSGSGLPGEVPKDPSFTIADNFCILGADGQYGSGKVGIKYGDTGKDWLRWSYIDTAKFIKAIRDNKEFFNAQLKKEKEALGLIEDLN